MRSVYFLHVQDGNFFYRNCVFLQYISDDPSSLTKPTNKLTQAIDVVRRTMEEQNCGVSDGQVYKKIPSSTKTFLFFKNVKNYLLGLLSNTELANCLAPLISQVCKIHLECLAFFLKALVIDNIF